MRHDETHHNAYYLKDRWHVFELSVSQRHPLRLYGNAGRGSRNLVKIHIRMMRWYHFTVRWCDDSHNWFFDDLMMRHWRCSFRLAFILWWLSKLLHYSFGNILWFSIIIQWFDDYVGLLPCYLVILLRRLYSQYVIIMPYFISVT